MYNLSNMSRFIILAACFLVFSANSVGRAQNLDGACAWTPAVSRSIRSLQSEEKIVAAEELAWRDVDILQVKAGGRLYFHTLPNEMCKTNLFIVKGDLVQIIDSYPKGSLLFNESFARVIFRNKKTGNKVIGWVAISALTRVVEE